MIHDYANRPYRTERRRAWPRVLGWSISVGLFALLMALTFYIEPILGFLKECVR